MFVKVSEIKVNDRIRKEMGNLEPLKESIKKYGLLQPIILDKKYNLIAGARRLQAVKELNWTLVDAKIIDLKDKKDLLQIEIDENNCRKDFTTEEREIAKTKKWKLEHPNIFVRFFNWLKGLFIKN